MARLVRIVGNPLPLSVACVVASETARERFALTTAITSESVGAAENTTGGGGCATCHAIRLQLPPQATSSSPISRAGARRFKTAVES